MQYVQDAADWRKYATKAEHSFLTTRAPSFSDVNWTSHLSSRPSKAVVSQPREFLNFGQLVVRNIGWAYQSVLILIVKVRAPKKRTLSSWLCRSASANAHPSRDLWIFCRVS